MAYTQGMTTTQNTPGYNRHLEIFFATDKRGNRRAYYWSTGQMRSFPLPLADAEIMQATGTADVLCCKPFQPRHTCGKPE